MLDPWITISRLAWSTCVFFVFLSITIHFPVTKPFHQLYRSITNCWCNTLPRPRPDPVPPPYRHGFHLSRNLNATSSFILDVPTECVCVSIQSVLEIKNTANPSLVWLGTGRSPANHNPCLVSQSDLAHFLSLSLPPDFVP